MGLVRTTHWSRAVSVADAKQPEEESDEERQTRERRQTQRGRYLRIYWQRRRWNERHSHLERAKRIRQGPKAGSLAGLTTSEWGERGSLAYYDERLWAFVAEAEALAEVRGDDYVDDSLSRYLGQITSMSWGQGDPLHLDVSDEHYYQDPDRIRKELAGLLPIDHKTDYENLPLMTPSGDYTVKGVALALGINSSAVYQMIYNKRLAAHRVAGQWIIYRADLERLQEQWRRPLWASARSPTQTPTSDSPAVPSPELQEVSSEKEMPIVEPIARPPILSIPDDSLWLRKRGEHRGEQVRVRRTNEHQVTFTIEKYGAGKGSRGAPDHSQLIRQRREWFLNHYEPANETDWQKAAIAAVPKPPPEETRVEPEQVPAAALTAEFEIDPNVEPEPLPEPEPEPVAAEPVHAKRRRNADDFTEPLEVLDIVEVWRNGYDVGEIARAYNAMPSAIYGLLDKAVPNEYRLRRMIDVLKRNDGGPIRQYVISQQAGYSAAECKAILAYGQAIGQVVRWEDKGERSTTTWVALPEKVPQPAEPAPEPEPVPVAAVAVEPPVEEEPMVVAESPPAPPVEPIPIVRGPTSERRWKVQIRLGVIEEEVDAGSLFAAAQEAMKRYPQGEVIGVTEA